MVSSLSRRFTLLFSILAGLLLSGSAVALAHSRHHHRGHGRCPQVASSKRHRAERHRATRRRLGERNRCRRRASERRRKIVRRRRPGSRPGPRGGSGSSTPTISVPLTGSGFPSSSGTASSTGTGSSSSPSSAPTPFFSPTSIWNAPLSTGAPLAPNSAAVVSYLDSFVTSSESAGTGPWINTTSYSTPIYTAPAGQATQPVYLDAVDANNTLEAALSAVPIPAAALPAAGADAEMVVYQPSIDAMWEFWGMHQSLTAPRYVWGDSENTGSLPAGTYDYVVTALSSQGETTPSPQVTVTVAPGEGAGIGWVGVPGATGYRVYRALAGQPLGLVATINHSSPGFDKLTWIDPGSETPTSAPPTSNTAATPGQWHAGWGGRMLDVSSDPGYYRNVYDGGTLVEQSSWGATASSLPIAGGLITLADLASGQIDHAVAMLVPKAKAGVHSCPAQRTDGYDSSPNAIPEGARFRLNPSLDLNAIAMPPITRMIAVAAQKYGLIVNDQTGVTVGFRAQDPTPLMRQGQANPYTKYFVGSNGQPELPSRLLASFPWSQLQLLTPPASCS
jgi:hypothetical protein